MEKTAQNTQGLSRRRIGYVRVSTHEQNSDLQIKSLEDVGCQEIFEDKISGAKANRPGLDAMMKFAEKLENG